MSIYNEYFSLEQTWKQKYGEKTIVLFQVGAFFEVYGVKDLTKGRFISVEPCVNGTIAKQINTIEVFSQISNLKIAPKSKTFFNDNQNQQILMAGFRDYQLEYYLEKITDNGFSAVVFVQEDKSDGEKGKNRIFSGIYSPGTFLSYNDNVVKVSNHIMCIWFKVANSMNFVQRIKATSQDSVGTKLSGPCVGERRLPLKFICGIVVIDIITGKSNVFEYESDSITYDELERYISIYQPNEVLFISQGQSRSVEEEDVEKLFQSQVSFHCIDFNTEKIKNVMKQTYIEEILNKQFGPDTFQNCFEFNNYPIATMAFCYLLDFIYEHNHNLVKNIEIPSFNNSCDRVILANHTLKQLNILDDGNGIGKLSSVLSFLNNCTCSIGKRRFRQQLLNPVYNESWLQSEYDMINLMLDSGMISPLRKMIGTISDLEKISRQLAIKKLYPSSIYQLYHSLEMVEQIHVCLAENPKIQKYLSQEFIDETIKNMMNFIKSHINIEKCNRVQNMDFDESIYDEDETTDIILCKGVFLELDTLLQEFQNNKNILDQWRETLNRVIFNVDTKKKIDETQYVKIHKTEKSGVSLQITKTRTKLLKEAFKNIKTITILGETIETKDIEFTSASTTANEIEHVQLTKISRKLLSLKESLNKVIDKEYKNFLIQLEANWFSFLDSVIQYVGKLDVLLCRAYNAIEYHYTCPIIERQSERSQVSVKNLRHVLIEHLLTNETYTTNDLELSREQRSSPQGIMLFGINSSGKTSLLRSLGISLILAQSGNFVPATSFEYKPYRSIYSRIIGNDNLFKGHSSFAVEMTELRVILKMANQYSMVLADEISKGSEMDSAMSITTASIMYFVKLQCSFMITSHLHEIVDFDEIRDLSNKVHLKHLLVTYDYDKDLLIYDRKLREGSGESFYGLLVCKSLHLPIDFIETAYQIRNKYLVKDKGILSQKTSVYNAKKIRGMCEICGEEMGEEIHHIVPQKEANSNGFLQNGIHMNHVGNLSSLCSKCHDKIHSTLLLETIKKKKAIKLVT